MIHTPTLAQRALKHIADLLANVIWLAAVLCRMEILEEVEEDSVPLAIPVPIRQYRTGVQVQIPGPRLQLCVPMDVHGNTIQGH